MSSAKKIAWIFYSYFLGLCGFIYDIYRFTFYSGWREKMTSHTQSGYFSILLAHALEKSLSYTNRKNSSGWSNANKLALIISRRNRYFSHSQNSSTYHRASISTLENFVNYPDNAGAPEAIIIKNRFRHRSGINSSQDSILTRSKSDLQSGILENPESFFLSRFTLREFHPEPISSQIIERAVQLAIKTPSVCNRQPWHVYHTSDADTKNAVLDIQNGNRPFGRQIPTILIITSDLEAFFSGQEHYQHWIDGGMFAMSLIYAFHSIGVSSCALNWSQTPWNDQKLRKRLAIKKSHTVIMCLGVGNPKDINKICLSPRKSITETCIPLNPR